MTVGGGTGDTLAKTVLTGSTTFVFGSALEALAMMLFAQRHVVGVATFIDLRRGCVHSDERDGRALVALSEVGLTDSALTWAASSEVGIA